MEKKNVNRESDVKREKLREAVDKLPDDKVLLVLAYVLGVQTAAEAAKVKESA